jgi:hypothetical protein
VRERYQARSGWRGSQDRFVTTACNGWRPTLNVFCRISTDPGRLRFQVTGAGLNKVSALCSPSLTMAN